MKDLKVEPNASNITSYSEIYSTAIIHELKNPLPMTIVSLEKIELSKSKIELTTAQTSEITALVFPENATENSITFKSMNEKIATVDNGIITAISNGETTIIAENEVTGIQSICNILVKTPNISKQQSSNKKYYVSNVPFINQYELGYPTGCEAVSATMAAKYAGYNVDVKTIIEHTPTDPLGKRQETRTVEKPVEVLNEETNENELVTTMVQN